MAFVERRMEAARQDGRHPSGRPVFWKEVYWLVVICLGGWIAALAILPPRLDRRRLMGDLESGLRAEVSDLRRKTREYEAAIMAMESDPFYRDEVYRKVLGVKRAEEEFLEEGPSRSR